MCRSGSGQEPPRDEPTLDQPDGPVKALDADPEPAEAFRTLTRGRRNGYVIGIRGAKKPETRVARMAGFRDRIIARKRARERKAPRVGPARSIRPRRLCP
jgi:uncharacterized protein YdeI (YjbR/CyaY-like superfamily)